jgi:hypothetical protein
MKHELSFTYSNGVPGIVAALIPRNDVKVRRENVNNLAFAFVAPLGSDYDDVFHNNSGTGHTSKREGLPDGAFFNRTPRCEYRLFLSNRRTGAHCRWQRVRLRAAIVQKHGPGA